MGLIWFPVNTFLMIYKGSIKTKVQMYILFLKIVFFPLKFQSDSEIKHRENVQWIQKEHEDMAVKIGTISAQIGA